MSHLLNLCNKILEKEKIPEKWAACIVKRLYKKSSVKNLENYLHIALLDFILKILTQMFYDRIVKWAEDHSLIPEFQCGFRKNSCCTDNISVLNGLIHM